eukprot:TRINITY_DN2010_c0_g1_i7.p1 TRINITY_DN2010_c0_g1~~TRINITY_DN2010_c0_g1_i7.p1  ORF type:complete len:498 (-),score=50.88 TRINITY_DN2010_c0_g1_i7:31-1524(-)
MVFHIAYLWGLKKLKAHDDNSSGTSANDGSNGNSTTDSVQQIPQQAAPISDVPGDDRVRMEAGQAEGGGDAPAPAFEPYALSPKEMKEQIIDKKMDPLTVIASFAADLDAASDWAFVYDLGHRSGDAAYPHVMRMYKAALAFTVVGTLIWLLVWSEFHPVASVLERITRWRTRTLSDVNSSEWRIPVGSILAFNMCLEDIPQVILSILDTVFSQGLSTFGAFNIAGSVFSVITRCVEANESWQEIPARAELRLVDAAPDVIYTMLKQSDEADRARRDAVWFADYAKYLRGTGISMQDHKASMHAISDIAKVPKANIPGQRDARVSVLRLDLDLSSCLVLSLPPSFGNLTALTSLNLSWCSVLSSLPASFGNLTALTTLRMSACRQLTSLPDSFGNLTALTLLNLSSCWALSSLPDSFSNLTALTSLSMWECVRLTELPDSFGNLTALTSLSLADCEQLAELPDSFGNLTALIDLDVRRCPATVPQALLDVGLVKVRK